MSVSSRLRGALGGRFTLALGFVAALGCGMACESSGGNCVQRARDGEPQLNPQPALPFCNQDPSGGTASANAGTGAIGLGGNTVGTAGAAAGGQSLGGAFGTAGNPAAGGTGTAGSGVAGGNGGGGGMATGGSGGAQGPGGAGGQDDGGAGGQGDGGAMPEGGAGGAAGDAGSLRLGDSRE